jgi:hypothetical protein
MIIRAKLINLEHKPALMFDRKLIDSGKIVKSSRYSVKFLNINQDIEILGVLIFNGKNACVKLGTKVKGYLNLEYNSEYDLELEPCVNVY